MVINWLFIKNCALTNAKNIIGNFCVTKVLVQLITGVL
jgi:hypothetical protein